MPITLTEQIYYNPSGSKDALDKIRSFAVSLGWTQDYWDTADGGGSDYYLQLWSPGYVNQEICYRFYITNVDAQEDTMTLRGVIPGKRYDQTSDKMTNTSTTWGGSTAQYYATSLPASTFDALYLYGDHRFIAAIYHVDPIAVITLVLGSPDLFRSWWSYPGCWMLFNPQSSWSSVGSASRWYNMTSNTNYWAFPYSTRGSSQYALWFEGGGRNSSYWGSNYRPIPSDVPGSENAAEFNFARGLVRYNSYTEKRTAFQSTIFAKSPSAGVWYPMGMSPLSWIHGYGLTIGETITFGSDQYRCFPGVFSTGNIWQAYRIS